MITLNKTITSGGENRTYILDVPYNTGEPMPVWFNFHGLGGTGAAAKTSFDMERVCNSNGFIAVHPDGLNKTWRQTGTNNKDMGMVTDILNYIIGQYFVDITRIFSSGFSMGGIFTHLMATRMQDVFQATGAVAASLSPGILSSCGPMPMMMIHSVNDGLVPYSSGLTALEFWKGRNISSEPPVVNGICSGWSGTAYTVFSTITGADHRETWNTDINGGFPVGDALWDFFKQ